MTAPWLQGAMIGVPLGGQVLFFSQTGMPRGPVTVRFDRTIGPDLVRTGASSCRQWSALTFDDRKSRAGLLVRLVALGSPEVFARCIGPKRLNARSISANANQTQKWHCPVGNFRGEASKVDSTNPGPF